MAVYLAVFRQIIEDYFFLMISKKITRKELLIIYFLSFLEYNN